jgi:hypothetical protein
MDVDGTLGGGDILEAGSEVPQPRASRHRGGAGRSHLSAVRGPLRFGVFSGLLESSHACVVMD